MIEYECRFKGSSVTKPTNVDAIRRYMGKVNLGRLTDPITFLRVLRTYDTFHVIK